MERSEGGRGKNEGKCGITGTVRKRGAIRARKSDIFLYRKKHFHFSKGFLLFLSSFSPFIFIKRKIPRVNMSRFMFSTGLSSEEILMG